MFNIFFLHKINLHYLEKFKLDFKENKLNHKNIKKQAIILKMIYTFKLYLEGNINILKR